MAHQPLFPQVALSNYLSDFRLSSLTNIRQITEHIRALIAELDSGKFNSLKEEEVKSRFISTFFGDVLGFNYGNFSKWLLREEKKSVTDGTKPDAALGYFFIESSSDIVKAIIELKDANTPLDKAQSRPDKQTPVEQAFGYVAKAGGNCKWVVVTNIIEIRFYNSIDASKYQSFLLKDLADENKLKELLYLFHKDRFIKENELSPTDKLFSHIKTLSLQQTTKPTHIIDRMYYCLQSFEGLGFVDPEYIASIYPFNILKDYVWHYELWKLMTLNNEICTLLEGTTVSNREVTFSAELKKQLTEEKVIDPENKLKCVFSFLNRCMVHDLYAVKDYKIIEEGKKNVIGFSKRIFFSFAPGENGTIKDIWLLDNDKCDCIVCNYRSLDFKRMLQKLKTAEGNDSFNTLEYAYGHYLVATNNFKKSYVIYKSIQQKIKGKQGKAVEYFISKLNMKYLYNLVLDYRLEDAKEIMSDIKSIDLDKVIYDEIEFDVEDDVKKYLIQIKEESLVYKIQDKIDDVLFSIEKLKKQYDNGGGQEHGPNLPLQLSEAFKILYSHVHRNYILYDIFRRYKSLTEKMFRGLVTSYNTPLWGLEKFGRLFITEAILNITPKALQDILKNNENLQLEEGTTQDLLLKLKNLTASRFEKGLMGYLSESALLSEQLINHRFVEKYTDVFSNLFTILSRVNILKDDFKEAKESIINFLQVEKELSWFDLTEFSDFLLIKGDMFEAAELEEILKIVINGHQYSFTKYSKLLEKIPVAISKFYPSHKINNSTLIQTAIVKCQSPNGANNSYKELINLTNICDDSSKQILLNAFERYLNQNFNDEFYQSLLLNANYEYQKNNYFSNYSMNTCTRRTRAYKYGPQELTDVIFYNYIIVLYRLSIPFERPELKLLTNLNVFETWIVNPDQFDYEKFQPKWLIDINRPVILNRLKGNKQISIAIEKELKKAFNAELSEIKYHYFS